MLIICKTIWLPEGTEVNYVYTGNNLARVRDRDGDTVRYNYQNERLNEIVKPDGSAVKINYGYTGAGGV